MKPRHAAVPALLANLRHELIAPPSESRAAEHVAMMRLEHQVLAPEPRRPALGTRARSRVARATATRPRRFAALFAAVCVLSGNVGINAAGALPAAVRQVTDHISDAIVHTFGVPQSSDPRAEGRRVLPSTRQRPGAPASTTPGTQVSGAPGSDPSNPSARPGAATGGGPGARGTSDPRAVGPGDPSVSTPGPQLPTGSPPPPSTNMQKDPRAHGLPSDWRTEVVAAARAQLVTCAQSTYLTPVGCPQGAGIDPPAIPGSVHWSLLNQPLAGAMAMVNSRWDQGAVISVYGLFQMTASYTATDGTQQYAYSGGVAEATMIWDGSDLLYVSFTSGSVADRLPAGVNVPSFQRPADVSDAAALAASQAGFTAWVTAGQGTLASDPADGATVSFDPQHGNFTVTGIYSTVAGDGRPGTVHHYAAQLVASGDVVQLLYVSST